MTRKVRLISVAFGLAAFACGGKVATTDAKVQGKLDTGSFPSTPIGVQAVDTEGNATNADLRGTAFNLNLVEGRSYQVSILLDGAKVPLVFPRGGFLDLNFQVKGGGALIGLGTIHYVTAAPASGLSTPDAASSCEEEEAGDDGDGDGEIDDEGDGDGECENGIDLTTGAACVDTDDIQADGSQPMAVGEFNVPNEVNGCVEEEDGEEQD